MRAEPSTLIIVVIIILFVVIYVDLSYTQIAVEHNTNIEQSSNDISTLIESKDNDKVSIDDVDIKSEGINSEGINSEGINSEGTEVYIKQTQPIEPDTSIEIDMNTPSQPRPDIDLNKFQIITAGLGPEVRRLGHLESELSDVRLKQIMNTNLLEKLYKRDVLGDYMTRGWFVQVYDVISTPHGVSLGAEIDRFHGIRRICFRAHNNFPFLGIPQDPMYLPKYEFIGFRAMTIFKIPKTGYYDFRVMSDDGSRLMYQVVNSDVMLDEKNIRSTWRPLIDQWRFQAETWNYSESLYFNQSDLVLLRFDYFQADANSSACIKVRYSETDENTRDLDPNNRQEDNFDDFNVEDLYCSLLWSDVPLMGFR